MHLTARTTLSQSAVHNAIIILSIYLSVRLYVTRVRRVEMVKHVIKLGTFSLYAIAMTVILIFSHQRYWRNSYLVTRDGGANCIWGRKNSRL